MPRNCSNTLPFVGGAQAEDFSAGLNLPLQEFVDASRQVLDFGEIVPVCLHLIEFQLALDLCERVEIALSGLR